MKAIHYGLFVLCVLNSEIYASKTAQILAADLKKAQTEFEHADAQVTAAQQKVADYKHISATKPVPFTNIAIQQCQQKEALAIQQKKNALAKLTAAQNAYGATKQLETIAEQQKLCEKMTQTVAAQNAILATQQKTLTSLQTKLQSASITDSRNLAEINATVKLLLALQFPPIS